jgi:hypothetical protein
MTKENRKDPAENADYEEHENSRQQHGRAKLLKFFNIFCPNLASYEFTKLKLTIAICLCTQMMCQDCDVMPASFVPHVRVEILKMREKVTRIL